jgi:hypothetical protein
MITEIYYDYILDKLLQNEKKIILDDTLFNSIKIIYLKR